MEIENPQSRAGKRVKRFARPCPAGESHWPHGDECRDEKNYFPVHFAVGRSNSYGRSNAKQGPEIQRFRDAAHHCRARPCGRIESRLSRRQTEIERRNERQRSVRPRRGSTPFQSSPTTRCLTKVGKRSGNCSPWPKGTDRASEEFSYG